MAATVLIGFVVVSLVFQGGLFFYHCKTFPNYQASLTQNKTKTLKTTSH